MNRIVKKKQKKMPDITEFLRNIETIDPNSDNVDCVEIIFRKYVNYRKLFYQLKKNLHNIYLNLKKKLIILDGLSDIILKINELQRKYFSINTEELEKLMDITIADRTLLKQIKIAHNEIANSELMIIAAKIGSNIARSKINKDDLQKFTYKCNSNLTSLVIFDEVDVETIITKKDANLTRIKNLKDIFDQSIVNTSDIRGLIYEYVVNIYKICKELNLIRKEPNFDIDKFFKSLTGILGKLGNKGEFGDALSLIGKSKELFRDNFNKYYKNFVNTGDGSVLVTNFLEDLLEKKVIDIGISESGSNKMSILMQLKKFINKIKTTLVASMKKRNATKPKEIDQLLDYVDCIFERMEKNDSDEPNDEENIKLMQKFKEQFL